MSDSTATTFASDISEFACPDCGNRRLRRLPRTGFLQTKVFPVFGYFPWECPICRETKYFRKRGKRVTRAKL